MRLCVVILLRIHCHHPVRSRSLGIHFSTFFFPCNPKMVRDKFIYINQYMYNVCIQIYRVLLERRKRLVDHVIIPGLEVEWRFHCPNLDLTGGNLRIGAHLGWSGCMPHLVDTSFSFSSPMGSAHSSNYYTNWWIHASIVMYVCMDGWVGPSSWFRTVETNSHHEQMDGMRRWINQSLVIEFGELQLTQEFHGVAK